MNNRTPTRERVPIHRIQKRLTDSLKQILRLQPGLPQPLRHTEQLLTRRASNDEVLCKVDAPDQVCRGDERLVRARGCLLQAGDDGLDEVGPEAAFVERGGDELGEGGGFDGAFFFDGVHVYAVAEDFAAGCGLV